MATVITKEQALQIAQEQKKYIDHFDNENKKRINEEKLSRLEAIQKIEIDFEAHKRQAQETQDQAIKEAKEELTNAANNEFGNIRNEMNTLKEELNGSLENAKNEASQAVADAKEELNKAVANAKEELDKTLDDLEKKVDELDIPVAATDEEIKPVIDLFAIVEE